MPRPVIRRMANQCCNQIQGRKHTACRRWCVDAICECWASFMEVIVMRSAKGLSLCSWRHRLAMMMASIVLWINHELHLYNTAWTYYSDVQGFVELATGLGTIDLLSGEGSVARSCRGNRSWLCDFVRACTENLVDRFYCHFSYC